MARVATTTTASDAVHGPLVAAVPRPGAAPLGGVAIAPSRRRPPTSIPAHHSPEMSPTAPPIAAPTTVGIVPVRRAPNPTIIAPRATGTIARTREPRRARNQPIAWRQPTVESTTTIPIWAR